MKKMKKVVKKKKLRIFRLLLLLLLLGGVFFLVDLYLDTKIVCEDNKYFCICKIIIEHLLIPEIIRNAIDHCKISCIDIKVVR